MVYINEEGSYTGLYDTEDMTEITTDAVAVGMITGKGFIGIGILGLLVLAFIGLVIKIKKKINKQ